MGALVLSSPLYVGLITSCFTLLLAVLTMYIMGKSRAALSR